MGKQAVLFNAAPAKPGAATYEMVVLYRTPIRSRVVKTRIIQPGQTKSISFPNTATDIAITVARRQATPPPLPGFSIVSETLLPRAGNVNIVARPERLIVDKPLNS
ncbi:hypothetical protein [Marininema halotolerans]|uniref:Uncharacterized protein n=1 Tax=Marininema halotolerans TaxID=1155944 RepID=A0A1I6UUS2_9BACL|nr:hypothetical protein [Marininema halotolerans]SFT05161.1 hypothetical protein SAMN05444972_1222 [Marininema halotolerans]